jgi:hypothetical protein
LQDSRESLRRLRRGHPPKSRSTLTRPRKRFPERHRRSTFPNCAAVCPRGLWCRRHSWALMMPSPYAGPWPRYPSGRIYRELKSSSRSLAMTDGDVTSGSFDHLANLHQPRASSRQLKIFAELTGRPSTTSLGRGGWLSVG